MPSPARRPLPAFLLLLALVPLSDCDGCVVAIPNPFRRKPVVCKHYLGCTGYPCPPKYTPVCNFEMSRSQGVCTCFLLRDGGPPPDSHPAHQPYPFHKNDAGNWVPDDDDGGT